MALQKRRLGKARIRHRRSSWLRSAGGKLLVQDCPNCGAPRVPHRICSACGFYGDRIAMKVAKAEDE